VPLTLNERAEADTVMDAAFTTTDVVSLLGTKNSEALPTVKLPLRAGTTRVSGLDVSAKGTLSSIGSSGEQSG
jgi:hypothetical protein